MGLQVAVAVDRPPADWLQVLVSHDQSHDLLALPPLAPLYRHTLHSYIMGGVVVLR